MPTPMQDNVFKFVSVRPPQLLSATTRRPGVAERHGQILSELEAQLRSLAGMENARVRARELAVAYMASESYIGRPGNRTEQRSTVELIVSTIESAHREGAATAELAKRLQQALGMPLPEYITSGNFRVLESTLWDGVYAHAVAPRDRPEDRPFLTRGVRALELLWDLANTGQAALPGSVQEYLEAMIVIPEQVIPRPRVVAPGGKLPAPTAPRSHFRTPEEVNPAVQRIVAAMTDVRQAARAHLDSIVEQQARRQPSILPPVGIEPRRSQLWDWLGVRKDDVPVTTPDTLIEPPWVLGSLGAQRLQESTRQTLRELGIAYETRNYTEVIQELETALTRTVATVDGGRGTLVTRIGTAQFDTGLPARTSHAISIVPLNPNVPAFPGTGQVPLLVNRVRTMIGDLMVVEQRLLRYDRGEVAHIENVMQTESRERKHRRLRRTEETTFFAKETSEESERDLQSTERFELQQESERTIQDDAQFKAGVTVSGGFGPVETTSYADYASQTSQSEANRTASDYARDVTERSVAHLMERVREERTRKTVEEFEENNAHAFVNDTAGHVIGIYRWVDKIYQAQVINYGQRLMLEMIVPEPAALYIFGEATRSPEGVTLEKPMSPEVTIIDGGTTRVVPFESPLQLQPFNYQALVGMYRASGVLPPPPESVIVSLTLDQGPSEQPGDKTFVKSSKELQIPDGYWAAEARVRAIKSYARNRGALTALIGEHLHAGGGPSIYALRGEEKFLPVAVHDIGEAYVISIEVRCDRKPQTLEDWQIKTFNAIMTAYENKKASYEEQLAAAAIRQGVAIAGRNPLRNREIEREELKKACITIIGTEFFNSFNAMQPGLPPEPPNVPAVYPDIDLNELAVEARRIQFFEQAFEWEQMTYLFYPYFWGSKNDWLDIRRLEDVDPLFTKFLQAGAARVLVPVRPPYNRMVLNYLSIDPPPEDPWNGADAPIIGSPLFRSIAEELRAQTGGATDGTPVGDPWLVKVPTSLVILDPGADLPDFTTSPGTVGSTG